MNENNNNNNVYKGRQEMTRMRPTIQPIVIYNLKVYFRSSNIASKSHHQGRAGEQ